MHTLIKVRKKWRPRRHSPNQPNRERRKAEEERKERRQRRWREGRGRKELTASWKKISRAGAIGSTEAMIPSKKNITNFDYFRKKRML